LLDVSLAYSRTLAYSFSVTLIYKLDLRFKPQVFDDDDIRQRALDATWLLRPIPLYGQQNKLHTSVSLTPAIKPVPQTTQGGLPSSHLTLAG